MLSISLPAEIEERLDAVVRSTGRSMARQTPAATTPQNLGRSVALL